MAQTDHLVLTPPPPPRVYHWRLLALANQLFEVSGLYVLNPHNLQCASLFDADVDWLADFHNYRQMLAYERDKRRRPREML